MKSKILSGSSINSFYPVCLPIARIALYRQLRGQAGVGSAAEERRVEGRMGFILL